MKRKIVICDYCNQEITNYFVLKNEMVELIVKRGYWGGLHVDICPDCYRKMVDYLRKAGVRVEPNLATGGIKTKGANND